MTPDTAESSALPTSATLATIPPAAVPEIETRKLCVVSTGHIPYADQVRLTQCRLKDGPEGFHGITGYGFHFYVPQLNELPCDEAWHALGYSNELAENIRALADAGFDRIEFDQDAPRVPGLHYFD